MSDYRNLQNLLKADKTFNRLSYIEKIICSCITNCNIELRLFQLGWLIRDLYKRGICEEELSDEQISNSLSDLLNKKILFENNEKFSICDSYFHSAYIFPLTLDTEKFSISLYSFANLSDFSFEVSYKQNIYSSILINLLNGNFNSDIFSSFDFSFLNNNSNTTFFNKLLEPFDESWFELLPEKSQIFLLNYAIYYELLNFDSILSNNGQNIFSYFMKPKW